MRVKQESERASLKLNIKKAKIRASNFMANRRGKCGSSDRFPLLGSKITVDGDWSHEIRGQLFLGRKAMTNLDSVLKSRDITLLTKVHTVNAMVFPVVTVVRSGP